MVHRILHPTDTEFEFHPYVDSISLHVVPAADAADKVCP
jgi:hypothetical protein